jgi:NADPH-dependent curcumin reductase CurA
MRTRAVTFDEAKSAEITAADFSVADMELDRPADGEVLVRTLYASVDPYLLLRIRDRVFDNGRIISRLIGRVEESRARGFAEGDIVLGFGHWQEMAVLSADGLRLLNPVAPLSAYLGVIGHSGFTASLGVAILDPQPGQTVTVSSAAGIVGSIAGQLAKIAGARVVGIAGGAKAQTIVDQFGFDAGVDHQAEDFWTLLAAAAPQGIDRHFENVGAKTLDPVLGLINLNARIALCGLIQHYGDGAPVTLTNFIKLLRKSVTMQAFHIEEHVESFEAEMERLATLVASGQLRAPETISHGLDALPEAFMAMLAGRGVGKHLVRVAE